MIKLIRRSCHREARRTCVCRQGGGSGGRRIGASDLRQLGYPAAEESSGQNWRAYRQRGAEGFHYAVFTAWREQEGEWLGSWSVASSFEGARPLEIARQRVEGALKSGYPRMLASHRRWWDRYWRASSVRLPNRIVERQWYLEQYKFGSAARRERASDFPSSRLDGG
jgi:alpha-L-fucosidase 2